MKNFYLWIVAAMICIGILPAAAQDAEVANIKFTVNIPNAEGIRCQMYGENIPLHDGANVLEIPNGSNISFAATLPWKITGVTDKNGTAASGYYGGDWYLYVAPSIEGEVFTITAINIDEFRTSRFTLNIDDPSLVNAMLSGYYQVLDLKAGENIVKYDPAMEAYLQLSPVEYNVPIYKVTMNGTEVAPQGNSYYIAIEEDCVFDVTATLPDEDHTVTFTYAEGAEGTLSVKVNGEDVPEFDGKQLVVKIGSQVTIQGNTTDYKYSEVKVNGQAVDFWGSYTFTVLKDSEVYVDAHPYGTITATVVISNPELISFNVAGNPWEMKAGENVLELSENNSNLSWNASANAIINSVTVNGTETLPSYQTYYTLNANDVIVFDVIEKVFDQKAIVWVDNAAAPACSYYIELSSPTDRNARYTFASGYNIVDFYTAMNPFSLSWYGYSEEVENVHLTASAYLNGELLAPAYENSTAYYLDLVNGDVLKLFMEAAPVECKVAFEIAEGVEATVVKDVITVVENPADGFDCFNGTQVTVTGDNLEVTVNGAAVAAEKDEDGAESFTFVVSDPETTVAVSAAGGSAVEAVAAEAASDVFNLQGVRVGDSLKGLPAGIYIVAGKKVVVAQ